MCSIYIGVSTAVVISLSWLASSVGMFKSYPRVVGAELDIWLGPPWPAQHTDSQGLPVSPTRREGGTRTPG